MKTWCHLPTIFNRRYALRIAGLLTLCVALTTTLLFAHVSEAASGVNKTLGFQGRLLSSNGSVVPDGSYNIQFKIYQDGDGQHVGNTTGSPAGSLKWTEEYLSGTSSAVEVRNGFFSVSLGSRTPFTNVDWNQDTLWLSMNVAGSAAGCTTFNSGSCIADGEMLPMKQITATPYSLNSGAVGGKTADNLVQLAQGVQTDASTNTSSIFINKTGSGNLIQLQSGGNDIFTVNNTGDLTLGSGIDHTLSIGTAATATDGNRLTVSGGAGGAGSGNAGGDLVLQGGVAGGTNGNGGNVQIDAGTGTGTGSDGIIAIGTSHASEITIGSTTQATSQDIQIGANNTASSSTNVTIGSGGNAASGQTTIQSKDDTTISTNGQQRARFSGDGNTLYVGNADTSGNATTANSFTIQGTSSTGTNTQGGSLTLQAGSASSGNANGGDLVLNGGTGSGTGSTGLVVINTPTFQTASSDAGCYTGGALVASSCTFTSASVNGSAVLIGGFSADGQVATLPDPANTTAGRIMYVTAAGGSKDFTLRANTGAGPGVEQNVTMRQNTTTTLVWNGSDWTVAGGSNSTTLQDVYNNTLQSSGTANIAVNSGYDGNGLTVSDNPSSPVNGTLFATQSATSTNLFSVNTNSSEFAKNGDAETAGGTASTFPANTWMSAGSSTISRYNTSGAYVSKGDASVKVETDAVGYSGTINELNTALTPGATYNVSLSARLESGTFTDLGVFYATDHSNIAVPCTTNVTVSTSQWTTVTCSFVAPASGITGQNSIAIGQVGATAHSFYIDNLSVKQAAGAAPNVKIGSGAGGDNTTLFTLDKSSSAPTAANNDALLGSMYYDTTLGKVQCYEADGWGACGASPDSFVTLSPTYANAVMHGSDSGTITSDLCSDALNINNGNSGQPTICGTKETFNFYKWTSAETTDQTRSIFVTYQLPSTFKEFVAGSTSLAARTDDNDAKVSYQVYRNNASDGLTACGSEVTVSTGVKTTWQKVAASSSADPSTCNFAAGDNIVIRVNLTSKDNANAYASDLNFTFSNR